MTLKIDSAGRVILPKPLRDRLGLHGGSSLEMQETAEGLVLTPARPRPALLRKGRFLVHTGDLPVGYDVLRAIDESRDARSRKVWGL